MKACPATMTLAVRSRFNPRIGRRRAFSRPWSVSEGVVGVGLGAMEGDREHVTDDAGVDPVPVRGDLHWRHPGSADRSLEEPAGGIPVPARREEHVDDLAELVDGPEQIAPGPSHLHVGLVDVPPITHHVPASAGGLGELRSEPMHPSVDAHMVDLDASLREELLHVPVGQAEPQVPTDGQGDDLGREAVSREG
jgi:hypothetical protein